MISQMEPTGTENPIQMNLKMAPEQHFARYW
jgi:hypothetical protein